MIGVVATGVLTVVPNVNVTVAGKADTDADGEKLHVTPAGIPLDGQASVTVPLNEPPPVTWKSTPDDVLPCDTEALAGDGAPRPKSTICKVTGATCVVADESDPTACTLNK